MAVDFGLLNKLQIPQGGVVATGTSSNSTSSGGGGVSGNDIGQGLQGLASGIQQGRENKRADALLQIQQNKDSREAQMFPGQLEQQQQVTEKGNIELDQAKQGQADAKTLRAALEQGQQEYFGALSKIPGGLEKIQQIQLTTAQIQNTVADVSIKNEEAKGKALENYNTSIYTIGNVYRTASGGASPQMQQELFKYAVSQMPENLQKLMPKSYDENSAYAGISLMNNMLVSEREKEEAKQEAKAKSEAKYKTFEPSTDVKNSKRLAELENLTNPTKEEQTELKYLHEANAANNKKNVTNPYETQAAEAGGTSLKASQELRDK
ncbi:MAG TPA: hypothetical protein VGK47_11155, partial [Nitrososphaeraceae archaeon]